MAKDTFWQAHRINQTPQEPPKKPGLVAREATVRGDEAGVESYNLEKGESVSDLRQRVEKTRESHRAALKRQQNVAAGKPAVE